MMTSAVGRKKRSAASIHRLMEEVPLWAAVAIQRGPRTAAMLNSSTSQKPISRRSWDLALVVSGCKRFLPMESTLYKGKRRGSRELTQIDANQPDRTHPTPHHAQKSRACRGPVIATVIARDPVISYRRYRRNKTPRPLVANPRNPSSGRILAEVGSLFSFCG